MTRKRFVKLLMSRGYSRNEAATKAQIGICAHGRYDVAYFAIRLIDGDSELMEAVQEVCKIIAEITEVPLSLLFPTME